MGVRVNIVPKVNQRIWVSLVLAFLISLLLAGNSQAIVFGSSPDRYSNVTDIWVNESGDVMTGNLTAPWFIGNIDCSNMSGGSDSDFCSDLDTDTDTTCVNQTGCLLTSGNISSLECGKLTGNTSDLCTIVDTDTDTTCEISGSCANVQYYNINTSTCGLITGNTSDLCSIIDTVDPSICADYNCTNIIYSTNTSFKTQVGDFWVNETGDTIIGDLEIYTGNASINITLNATLGTLNMSLTNANILTAQNATNTIGDSANWWYGYFSSIILNGANVMTLFLPISGGTLTGNLNLGGNNIVNVGQMLLGWGNITDLPDFITEGDKYVNVSGDTMSGDLKVLSSGSFVNITASSGQIDTSGDVNVGGALTAGGGYGDSDGGFTVNTQGDIFTDGSLTFSGDTYVVQGQVINGSIIPQVNDSLTLGNSTYIWQDVYTRNLYLLGTVYGKIGWENITELPNFITEGDKYVNVSGDVMSGDLDIGSGTGYINITASTGEIASSGNLTVDTNVLHVDTSQDMVGIGIIDPKSKLDVVGNELRLGPVAYPASYSVANSSYLVMDKNSTAEDASIVFRDRGNARAEIGIVADNDIHFKTVTGNYGTEVFTDRLLIRSTGEVDSFGLLRAYKTSGTASVHAGNTNGSTGAGLQMTYEFTNTLSRITSVEWGNVYRDLLFEGNNLRFLTGTGTVSENMRITSSGDVGIGDTSPASLLTVHGDAVFYSGTGYINLTASTGDINSSGNLTVNYIDTIPVYDGTDLLVCHYNKNKDCANGETGTYSGFTGVWHFEEGTGTTTADDSGLSNTLTLINTPTWTASGKYGNALDFERDSTEYLQRADDPDFDLGTGDVTLGAWVKLESGGLTTLAIFGKFELNVGAYFLKVDANDNIYFKVSDGTDGFNVINTNVNVNDGEWHFVAATWDASTETIQVYVDGDLVSGTNSPVDIDNLDNAGAFQVGALAGGNTFDGIIDEPFFIKGSVLSQTEIDFMYNNRMYGATYFNGKFDKGYYAFTGNSLSYSTTDNIDKEQGTIEMWVNTTWNGDDGVRHIFFDMGTGLTTNRLTVIKETTNKLGLAIYDNSGNLKELSYDVDSTNFANNTWHHIAVTWDNGEFQLFLDGALVNDTESGTGTGKLLALPSSMYIGRNAAAQGAEAQAIIDELRISSRPLTADEIWRSYNSRYQFIEGET